MSAIQLIQYLSWVVFELIFVVALIKAVRQPRRATIDAALLFGAPALSIILSILRDTGVLAPSDLLGDISGALILSLAYLLLRLVDDFSEAPAWLVRGSLALLIALVVGLFAYAGRQPAWLSLAQVAYFVALEIYAAVKFIDAARRTVGVTRRRMQAAAAGSLALALLIFGAGVQVAAPLPFMPPVSILLGLAAGVGYFLAFAPPAVLRRAWQEPELRAFLGRAARLPRLPDTAAIVAELERSAARALGAPSASIGLWDGAAGVLRFVVAGEPFEYAEDVPTPAVRAFARQQPLFVANVPAAYPGRAGLALKFGARALLAAPITAGEQRLGVLAVYAPRAPMFADDDLALVELLANQAAVILESRALIDEAARVQAREEATRLKDDFLSAAAHDLKTPLTALIGRTQLMERRALRDPQAPADLASIRMVIAETRRLKHLVLDLLDAARAERGGLITRREELDLAPLARAVCERYSSERHQCLLTAEGALVGAFDALRIGQLFDNLIANAVKYSPEGGPVRVDLWREDGRARLVVADCGIGIPAGDMAHIFDRFHRGSNVDDRRFSGMGLGLYICRGIVEEHGGAISAQPNLPQGTQFHVSLPLVAPGGCQ